MDTFPLVMLIIVFGCIAFIVIALIVSELSSQKQEKIIQSQEIRVNGTWAYIEIESYSSLKYRKMYTRPYFHFEYGGVEYTLPSCHFLDEGKHDIMKPVELFFNPQSPKNVLPVADTESIDSV